MMELSNIKLDELAVISDFDGTITNCDTNDLIFSNFGNEINSNIEQLFKNNEIGTREAMEKHFEQITMSEQQYIDYIQNNVSIRDGFYDFARNCMENAIPLSIVSGGFENIINQMLREISPKIACYARVYANRLNFQGEIITPKFKHTTVNCVKEYGPCGNCKRSYVKDLQYQNYQVIFIGDGLTDRCGAENADFVFARDALIDFCRNEQIPFLSYEDFTDVKKYVFDKSF